MSHRVTQCAVHSVRTVPDHNKSIFIEVVNQHKIYMYILHQIFPQKTKILNLRYFDQSACIAIKQQNDFVSKGANHFPGPPEKAACFNPSICLAALTKIYLYNLFIVFYQPWNLMNYNLFN